MSPDTLAPLVATTRKLREHCQTIVHRCNALEGAYEKLAVTPLPHDRGVLLDLIHRAQGTIESRLMQAAQLTGVTKR